MIFIIYQAVCLLNKETYVGQTSKTLNLRKNQHKATAKRGSDYVFHKAIRKHGFENFVWIELDRCQDQCEANRLERVHINNLKPRYNMTDGGFSTSGFKHSAKTKRTIKDKVTLFKARKFEVIKEDSVVGVWLSQQDCAKSLGLAQSHISHCLTGKRPHHKGYTFRYSYA